MGKIGEEITQKIKSAVKAKLIELGVEIDNELPDYIMVLVANKKSQESMIKDLQLFLGPNTVIFTAWLHNVLKKLEEVTVSSRGIWKNNNSSPSTDTSNVQHFECSLKSESSCDPQITCVVKKEQELESDTDCLEISASGALYEGSEETVRNTGKHHTNIPAGSQEKQNSSLNKRMESAPSRNIVYSSVNTSNDNENERDNESSSDRNKLRLRSSIIQKDDEMNGNRRKFVSAVRSVTMDRDSSRLKDERSKERSKFNDRHRRDVTNEKRTKLKRGSDRTSKVLDAREILRKRAEGVSSQKSKDVKTQPGEKRRKILPSVAKPIERPLVETVQPRIPSLVKVTPRPVRRTGVQPNKKLLLKAVADAEKSIARVTISQKKRDLFDPEEEDEVIKSPPVSYVPPEKIFITLQNQDPSQLMGNAQGLFRECSTKEPVKEPLHSYEESYYDNYETNYESESQQLNSPSLESESWKTANLMTVQNIMRVDNSPKCIITLGNSSPEKSDEWDEDMTEMTETVEGSPKQTFEWNRLGPPPVAAVKPSNTSSLVGNENPKTEGINKALQRCKYWPNCLDKACIYYHPSIPCKLFPLCKYGDQCLFIHPDCKFGASCLNFSCNYLHRTPLKDDTQLPQVLSAKLCSFFPNCSNPLCKFRHPVKICKFGKACARSDCFYFHPKKIIPPKELLSWKAK